MKLTRKELYAKLDNCGIPYDNIAIDVLRSGNYISDNQLGNQHQIYLKAGGGRECINPKRFWMHRSELDFLKIASFNPNITSLREVRLVAQKFQKWINQYYGETSDLIRRGD